MRPDSRWRPWSEADLRALTTAASSFGLGYLVRKTGRSPAAIYNKVQRAFGGGGITRGTKTIAQLEEDTGYTERQLIRAGKALGQRWLRSSTFGKHMLSEDQAEALVRWLRHDYWSSTARTYACVYCGRSSEPHRLLGLCASCGPVQWRCWSEAGLCLSRVGLLSAIAAVKESTSPADHDWLDAFKASVEAGCVLTRGTLDRLREEASGQLGG